ncbi:deoxyribonuclease IV [Candidatus Mycoplasma mahonii]|uniref:deoxyribonuclease IV n=1 Tax=Candidatus Mycoplasma mahonii TaxID=3004105 RepID=UPI0026F25CA4|nr:deoxyribonuclease IV [Candidatus Mycoplasma mahonii]WKX02215.1 deoxyribonuclease IV [Candidatus Mycoplasma mahonii]
MIKLGSHTPFKAPNYLMGALEFSKKNKANTMMIYLGAPQNTRRIPMADYQLKEYLAAAGTIPVEDIVIHAPYIVNPASVDKHQFAVDFLVKDIERINYIGAKYMVLHPGAHTKFTREEGLETLIASLKEIFKQTQDVEIMLETMAGKGTELGTTFEELKYIIDQVDNKRLGICLDTCHVWEAGYDIKDYGGFIKILKDTGVIDYIKVFHINDSKNEMSAHKDRHENIGKGYIGTEALRRFVVGEEFKDIIKVLETPYVDKTPIYKEEIEILLYNKETKAGGTHG